MMQLREEYEENGLKAEKTKVSPEGHSLKPEDAKGVRVAWGIPCYGPFHLPNVYSSHLAAAAYASRYLTVSHLGDLPMVGATDRMYTHSAANEIVRQCLAEPSVTHIFWTEMDMVLPTDVIPRLLALKRPIAAGVYFLRGGSGQPCLYKRTPVETKENPYLHTPITIYDERAPFRVDCPGMGCVLTEVEVFKKIKEPWFDLKANDVDKKNGYGQDLYFYTKVRWAGIEVWVDPSVICDQVDTVTIGYADYRKKLAEHGPRDFSGGFVSLDPPRDGSEAEHRMR